MSLLETFTFLSFWAVGLGLSDVEQSQISISTEVKKSINIHCKITSSDFEGDYIHWYRQKPKKALEHLISVSSTKSPARASLGGRKNKLEARKYSQTSTSVLTVNFIENEDVAIYYCAGWDHSTRSVETTHTRSPLWVCAHPHPSQQWQPQPGPAGLLASASPSLYQFQNFLGSHFGLKLAY
uniref:Ig-like domain-containing protein n=1 Tax=Equus caballus TaxID=9796 RepID=A0A9L0S3H7_HORSE